MMKFIDLAAQQRRIRPQLMAAVERVLDHCQFIMGPEVQELETRLAAYVGVRHAVGCASGTDALLLSLMSLGVGPGDAVFTTPFTFMATAEAVALLGAVPVFADIEPESFNIDPESLERAIRALEGAAGMSAPLPRLPGGDVRALRPKAVIAVDMFGVPADYDRIEALCRRHGLALIEDAAQSFGAVYRGRKAGSFGAIGCTSFFPSKPLGGYGDGGMCFTNDDGLAAAMRSLRVHGQSGPAFRHDRLGINGRLDTLQAAVLLAKLEVFEEELERRRAAAACYTEILRSAPGLRLPAAPEHVRSAWAQFTVSAVDGGHRASLLARLKAAGIPHAVYYPEPLHLQTALKPFGFLRGDFPLSEEACGRVFSLPMHPYLARREMETIGAVLCSG
jgi:dTDP-4-amino-4,6-dideoxygalactose transaminase